MGVNLDWTVPESGAAPITSYTIERAKNAEKYGATLRVQDSRGKASAAEALKQICEKCLKEK